MSSLLTALLVFAAVLVGSVAGAIFLTVEMYSPFDGFLRVSDAPFRTAVGYIKQ